MADVQLLRQEQEKDEEEEEKEVESEFVEMDPTGRYGRYREILGKGASKTVYKAFDEIEGIEMAWNQVKLQKVAKTPEDLRRICSEVHLLKTLKHKNIIKFYASWIDAEARHINFVTEMFTSGSLRQYRKKHKQVDLRAIKNWARQILRGLLYLHSHDPPIIHRDLKCDNILVNGNQGEVKIGDLGLAAILRKSQSARTVIGTPEFMAPELYEEEYNELVDIYAFGMCLIEMLTFDYPYSECSSTVHIYKKVMARKKPEALYKIKDPEVRRFIEKCLASASTRLSARELLLDPFLGEHGYDHNQYPYAYCDPNQGIVADIAPIGGVGYAQKQNNESMSMMGLLQLHDESSKQPPHNMDFTVKGKRGDNRSNIIQLRLRILDSEGRIRSIYFPFDVKEDTAMSVAAEMVAELDLTDQDVTKIAQIIDQEIMPLFPDWKALLFSHDHDYHDNNHNTINTNMNNEERDKHIDQDYCCRSNNKKNTRELAAAGGHQHVHGSTVSSEGSLLEFVRSHCCVDYDTSQTLVPCTKMQCAAMHGRFEEVTFQLDAAAEYSSFLAEDDDDDDAPPISSGSSSDLLILVNEDYSAEEAELEPESAILAKKSILQQETIAAASASASASASSQDLSEETCWHLWDGDDDDSIISRELRVLAIKHQQELRQLQRRHARALLEIECRLLQKQRAPPTSALYHDVADTKVRSQNNVCRIHQKNFCQKMNFCRNCIAGSSSKRNLESDVGATAAGSRAIRKSRSKTQVSAKPRTSSSASHRSSPKAISIPSPARARTNCRRSTPDHYKKLTKMQSFSSDADYGSFVNSLSREVNKDGHPQRMRIGKFQ